MGLTERVESELQDARRHRDQVALGALELLKSEIVNASKEPGAGAPDDQMVIRVARKEVKRREEAAAAFRAAGRSDRAGREEAEAEVLRAYLPAPLADDELEAAVRAVIEEVRPEGPQGFGAVMKAAQSRLGDRAEGGRIAAVARRLLAG